MDAALILKHLIGEGSFPAWKLAREKVVEVENFDDLPKMTASQYLNEVNVTTDERHKLLTKQQRNLSYRRPGVEVKIQPPIIVFQNYKFGETLKFPITIYNLTKKSQKVAVLMDENATFKFDECSTRVSKFPAGMSITTTVNFTPESATDDYFHTLFVSTNQTKVTVPIIAIGIRPVLDAPDTLFLSDSPVRHWTTKPVTVLNVGKRTARFTLDAIGPFCVKPEKGIVLPNHAFTFNIAYFPRAVTFHEGEVRIKYDNGEEVFMQVKANAINYDIKLSSGDTRCEDTYMSLQTRSTIYIENKSNITATFVWRKFVEKMKQEITVEADTIAKYLCDGGSDEASGESEEMEEAEEEMEGDEEEDEGEEEEGCFDWMVRMDENGNLREDKEADRDDMFHDENFHIYPLFGEIKPNSKAEVHIIFSPKECKFYDSNAYLDVTGLERRIPFDLHGRGLGPKFRLAFEVLNVGEVALGGSHTYEVPVQNISEIPGIIEFNGLVGPPSGVGMKIEPRFLEVAPFQFSAFYVNFVCTGKVGLFEDEMKFSTRDTEDSFYVTVMGELTFPSIKFATKDFDLGLLSYGFPQTYYIPLVNESLNHVQVEVKMEDDGEDPPLDLDTILSSFKDVHFQLPTHPAEFTISPVKFALVPRGVQNIQLTMYPNQIRKINNKLKSYVKNSYGQDVETVASINIQGDVIVPSFQVVKDLIIVKDCYIHYPHAAELIIKNNSELPVIYCVVHNQALPAISQSHQATQTSPQKSKSISPPTPNTKKSEFHRKSTRPSQHRPSHHHHHENHPVKVTSENFVGVADPWVETRVPFEVTTTHPGESIAILEVHTAGVEEKIQAVTVKCESVVMKVEASQKNIDFGKIPVLEENSINVDVTNTTPMNVPFVASIIQEEPTEKGEVWKITPEMGTLASKAKQTFTAQLLTKEVGYHYSTIKITIQEPHQNTIEVKVKGLGVGSPLVFDPPIQKKLLIDFGTVFIKQEGVYEYKVTNHGVNPQVLEWSPIGEKAPVNKLEVKVAGGRRAQQRPETPVQPDSAKKRTPFQILPLKQIIKPKTTATVTITAFSNTQKNVEEVWNAWTYVPVTKKTQVEPETAERSTATASSDGKRAGTIRSTTAGSVRHTESSVGGQKKRKHTPLEPKHLHLKPSIISEVKIHAAFEAPALKFSKKTLNFLVDATPTQEEFVCEEVIRIENSGTLPITVKFRTKHPFAIYCHHEDFPKEEVTITFEAEKVVQLRVQFDGRHLRKENGIISFNGKIECVYEGLTGTENIELVGTVRYPELELDRVLIDFGQISNGMEAIEQVTVTNPGAFCLTYKWYIKPNSTQITRNAKRSVVADVEKYRPSLNNNPLSIFDDSKEPRSQRSQGSLGISRATSKAQLKVPQRLGLKPDFYMIGSPEQQEFTDFIREKMYRSRMMDYMGLKDSEYEAEDEVNYLAYYNQQANQSFNPQDEFNSNELVDVIPLAGVIQAGQSQSFTFVFYGYPDISFKTDVVLYVEGGTRKTVHVTGSTHPPHKQESKRRSTAAQQKLTGSLMITPL